ncbi:Coadhesin,Thrombospondin-1,Mucin-like protein,Hemicentin-1,Adhesion G protein-coupled receptor B3 [Mytilus coruscus]|uniref:Coadhesin,Thrombospondin-1,Mucin-like protein,Hemicentin-1,Adhesion G protein-coupled receptor B3 n=1 Tax=Mytilus coruscus TaxID=42192 RepID=A0A6J8ENH4_MYTCO|nr:Coadhesin,Thrombospondin-1,Mucin-like protein,Hemicentin-1,Adhesion G protein-coupled receptor B3 [Mytilus coruscus]
MLKQTLIYLILLVFPTVNGSCSKWTCWTPCSVTCGSGSQERRRICHNPARAKFRPDCRGSRSESRPCTVTACPINGNWTEWSLWSDCYLTCGLDGGRYRTRTCDNPAPANNGRGCSGSGSEKEQCNLTDCPINGNWTEWSLWSGCSLTCGLDGGRYRTRTSDNPAPANNGWGCSGSGSEKEQCNLTDCPINGNWTEWSLWSGCSLTCGLDGGRYRTRTCDNPAPANNGRGCSGSGSEKEQCNLTDCPINGNWTEWSLWSGCSLTCGLDGGRYRTRTCDNPAPANNGRGCSGSGSEKEQCNLTDCPINGNWTEWSLWSGCSLTCGLDGGRYRTRTCDNPAPANNGRGCSGSGSEKEQCNLTDCPINGNWTEWSLWSGCSLTCGLDGGRYRTRTCDNPAPANSGRGCSGSGSEKEQCNLTDCPINGNWTEWSLWSDCSLSCGLGGGRYRTRTCDNPAPANNGRGCSGSGSEKEQCKLTDCPINGNWTEWSLWSDCSLSCGLGGGRYRTRTCDNPAPANNGRGCSGSGSEKEQCKLTDCPINGNWAEWSLWSKCSISCGSDGNRFRDRTCSDPEAANGGRPCTGRAIQAETCELPGCPI